MDKLALYETWAPEGRPWSPWVKPAIFAHYPRPAPKNPPSLREDLSFSWLPRAHENCALIVELPGPEAVLYGLKLAELGYRPVPVFASCPPEGTDIARMAVDADGVLAALQFGAAKLGALNLPDRAPPAFLIDARRRMTYTDLTDPDTFDNRSAVFEGDFPSSATMREKGVARCLLIRESAMFDARDLGYALASWKRDRFPVEPVDLSGADISFEWPPEGFFRRLFARGMIGWGLKENDHGGYGRFIGETSRGTGG